MEKVTVTAFQQPGAGAPRVRLSNVGAPRSGFGFGATVHVGSPVGFDLFAERRRLGAVESWQVHVEAVSPPSARRETADRSPPPWTRASNVVSAFGVGRPAERKAVVTRSVREVPTADSVISRPCTGAWNRRAVVAPRTSDPLLRATAATARHSVLASTPHRVAPGAGPERR
jgi:hypothetical protein